MIAFVYPGQGSQKKGMGKDLFKKYADYVAIADRILGYSIEELCLENPENKLNLTEYTQVAIFVVNALTHLDYVKTAKIKPDFVAGHSLGEYNALFAAKVIDFETGLKLVRMRGKLMGKVTGGGMAAVLGLSGEQVSEICSQNKELNISVANYNTDTQIIIAGEKENVMRSKELFTAIQGVRFSPLNVSGAFHSHYMTQPKIEYERYMSEYKLNEPEIPIISNVTAREYEGIQLSRYLVEQMDSSVKWSNTIEYLLDKGVKHFVEIGESEILTRMITSIRSDYVPKTTQQQYEKHIEKVEVVKEPVVRAEQLGSDTFRSRYNLKYSYLVGGMYQAISSKEMILSLAEEYILGFYGSGGTKLEKIKEEVKFIKSRLTTDKPFGVNIVSNIENEKKENSLISFLLEEEVNILEASGYIYITKGLVRYQAKGLYIENGSVKRKNHIIAKVSRPEVAELFMSPAPENIIKTLMANEEITTEQANWLRSIPIASDICVEADSGGHTDQGVMAIILPAVKRMMDKKMRIHNYKENIHVGAAGGIGTPEAAAAAFLLGADFIMTGSINQCSVEAGTSSLVKDMLEKVEVQDTEYAPAGDMLEFGSKVQVLKKGTFFPARANKLYDVFKHNSSLVELDSELIQQIENSYLQKSMDQILREERDYMRVHHPEELVKLEVDEKYKLLTILKYYFRNSSNYAIEGLKERKVDYQIQCGKAMGAFNDWVRGTGLEEWQNRTVTGIAELLMNETAVYIKNRIEEAI